MGLKDLTFIVCLINKRELHTCRKDKLKFEVGGICDKSPRVKLGLVNYYIIINFKFTQMDR